jgi:hypothetical protein
MQAIRAALCGLARSIVVRLRRIVDRCCLERPTAQHASRVSFHAGSILLTAFRARNRAVKEMTDRNAAGQTGVLTADAIVAIVIAAAATEAFINELAENIGQYRQNAWDWAPDAITSDMSAAADAIFDLEFIHRSVTEKYAAASAKLGKRFDKGGNPYQDFVRLMELRNAIMHIKPVRPSEAHSGEAITDELARQKRAMPREVIGLPWFDRLQTPETARWACNAARTIILGLLDLIPETSSDPLGLVKNLYQNHVGFQSEDWV